MNRSNAPVPTLRRLPAYLRVLEMVQESQVTHISCTRIANELHLDPTQVRKDLSFTGIVGRPRVGYEVVPLMTAIECFLGWNSIARAVLIGVGSLGTALLGYEDFSRHGLVFIAAFDADTEKIGVLVHGRVVRPIELLGEFIEENTVEIGVLTLPAAHAQEVADHLVAAGIKGIWNFTPADLKLPVGVIIENVRLAGSLAVLSARLTVLRHRSQEV